MKNLYKLLQSFFGVTIISLIFAGCGSDKVLIAPKYESKLLKTQNRQELNAKVIKVNDNRGDTSTTIGTAQVGLFNKEVPYMLGESVADFVKKSVTKILSDDKDTAFLPLNIIINKFNVHEETGTFSEMGYFESELVFVYPVGKDSLISVNTFCSEEESSGMDVTNGLEYLIYKGMSSCTDMFLNKYHNRKSNYITTTTNDTLFEVVPASSENIVVADTGHSVKYILNSENNLGASYNSGQNVKHGIQLFYQSYDSLNNNLWGGFGYTFSFFSIENKAKYLEGSFINFNYRYSLRYFPIINRYGLYFSGALKISFGSEAIDYSSHKETNFFIGPIMEESIGISIFNKVYLEAGAYQLKFFGSDLLPDDVGYSVGILFKI